MCSAKMLLKLILHGSLDRAIKIEFALYLCYLRFRYWVLFLLPCEHSFLLVHSNTQRFFHLALTLQSITGSSNLCQCMQQPVVPLCQPGILDNVNVMHQKIRNQEDNITTSPPLTKQHQREKTLDVLTQKEQQEQSEV